MADILALAGFMGCGKSTVAAILAGQSHGFYFDLDDTIQMEEGRSIGDIFASDGEKAFRDLEYKYLERIISDYGDFEQKIIIALGGGTVTDSRCAALLRERCSCIYMRASAPQLVYNLKITGVQDRPLLSDAADDEAILLEKVGSLLESRNRLYEEAAGTIIDIDGLSPEQIAEEITSQRASDAPPRKEESRR